MRKNRPPAPPKGNKRALGNNGGAPEIYTLEWLQQEADRFLEWMKREDSVYFKSFAIERGYSPQRFTEFAEKSPEFSEVYKLAKDWQEQKLVKLSLWNKINSGMTKFVLTNHHSWMEKAQISGDAANPMGFLLGSVDGTTKNLIDKENEPS